MKYYNDLKLMKKLYDESKKAITLLNESNGIIVNAICQDFSLKTSDIYEKMGISRQHFYFYKKYPHWRFNLKLLDLYFKLCGEAETKN